MTMQADLAPQPAGTPLGSAARCPHLIFRDVLGAERVAAMLDYVAGRQDDFKSATIRSRKSGERVLDQSFRDCLSLKDLDVFEEPIRALFSAVTPQALDVFRMIEPSVELRELGFLAYGDGGYFRAHIDTTERLDRLRLLSFVYYFATTPRRFRGGELRLHGFPVRTAGSAPATAPFIDVPPDTDTLVIFPSWLRHEVLPVHVESGAWIDGRFAIGCWLHRTPDTAASGAGAG
jgi:SM-20-related protein